VSAAPQKAEVLPVAQILRDPALNCRAEGVNETVAAEYAEALSNGAKFPPVIVFKEGGVYRLADGWHRCRAHELAGKTEIACDVRPGGEREARLYAVGANASHGARRTKADRWRAVEMLLLDPAWAVWSDREIAKQAAVDPKFVAPVRASLAATVDNPQLTERKGADGKIRKVSKPKKKRKAFDSARAAKTACKALEAVAKKWPAGESREPLVAAVQAWLATASAGE
jgi:hypothetical protein